MEDKFKWSRKGSNEAREYLKSINKWNKETFWFSVSSLDILNFANKMWKENNK